MDKLGEINATDKYESQVQSVFIYSTETLIVETQLLDLIERLQFVPKIWLEFVDIAKLDIDNFKLKLENLSKQGEFKTRDLILLVPDDSLSFCPEIPDYFLTPNSHHFNISNNGEITMHVHQ